MDKNNFLIYNSFIISKKMGGMILIGERLYDLRKDAGMTQDELAELLKISKHSISAYERDKNEPPDSIKIAIARLFNVSVDYLVG